MLSRHRSFEWVTISSAPTLIKIRKANSKLRTTLICVFCKAQKSLFRHRQCFSTRETPLGAYPTATVFPSHVLLFECSMDMETYYFCLAQQCRLRRDFGDSANRSTKNVSDEFCGPGDVKLARVVFSSFSCGYGLLCTGAPNVYSFKVMA